MTGSPQQSLVAIFFVFASVLTFVHFCCFLRLALLNSFIALTYFACRPYTFVLFVPTNDYCTVYFKCMYVCVCVRRFVQQTITS